MKSHILITVGAPIGVGLASYVKLKELGWAGIFVSIGAALVIFLVLRAYSYPDDSESTDTTSRKSIIERLTLLLPLLFILLIVAVALITYLII